MTIFYSWQSDLESTTNRYAIRDALEDAAKQVASKNRAFHKEIQESASGYTGSPDIFQAVLAKIDDASVFVSDVTPVSFLPKTREAAPTLHGAIFERIASALGSRAHQALAKPLGNPNVLIELGYALGKLRSERIILVLNEAYGALDALPFDLGTKRVVPYRLRKGSTKDERKTALKSLAGSLAHRIREILAQDDGAEVGSLQIAVPLYWDCTQELFSLTVSNAYQRAMTGALTNAIGVWRHEREALQASAEGDTLLLQKHARHLVERAILAALRYRYHQSWIVEETTFSHGSQLRWTKDEQWRGECVDTVNNSSSNPYLTLGEEAAFWLPPGALLVSTADDGYSRSISINAHLWSVDIQIMMDSMSRCSIVPGFLHHKPDAYRKFCVDVSLKSALRRGVHPRLRPKLASWISDLNTTISRFSESTIRENAQQERLERVTLRLDGWNLP